MRRCWKDQLEMRDNMLGESREQNHGIPHSINESKTPQGEADEKQTMAGVWKFGSNGVLTLDQNLEADNADPGSSMGRKVLVHSATNELIKCYEQLDVKLLELGWHPYFRNQHVRQYHRSQDTVDLITLPPFFQSMRPTHMYDIVVKTRSGFQVRSAS